QTEKIDRRVLRAEDLGQRDADEIDAGTAVDRRVRDDGGDDEGHRDRHQRKELASEPLDTEDDETDRRAERRGEERRDRQGQQERHAEFGRERRRSVDAGAEESGVAEAPIPGKTREDVPARRHRDPEEHEIEERDVIGRNVGGRHRDEDRGEKAEPEFHGKANRAHTQRGLKRRSAISTEKDTSEAQDGLTTAMVSASHTPIRMPPASAPIGLPSRPMITTAKTTPTQAQICDGARVATRAMKKPATPA